MCSSGRSACARRSTPSLRAGAATDEDRAAVAREVELAASSARLEWGSQGAAWILPATPDLPLLAVAQRIGSFVLDPIRVGRCPGSRCGWLFADPRGRRRWCSMATCGNRAKARRHAAKGTGG